MSAATTLAPPLSACRLASVIHGHGKAEVTALRDANLELAGGERVALWGPSGSGKTTLLHVLGGLIVPSTGEVRWRGEPLSSLDAAARSRTRARGIAFVFQGSNLLPTLTAVENVAFAAYCSSGGVSSPGLAPERLLALVGLAGQRDALPHELSGGEAQRVAIARALAQQPLMLLCDEPTGHLDSNTGERVLDLIDALQRRFSFALVTATHDPDVAARFDRVITLADGHAYEAAGR